MIRKLRTKWRVFWNVKVKKRPRLSDDELNLVLQGMMHNERFHRYPKNTPTVGTPCFPVREDWKEYYHD